MARPRPYSASEVFRWLLLALVGGLANGASAPAQQIDSAAESAAETEESVRPNINERFLDPELNLEEWVERFETESREVFRSRAAIVQAVRLKKGDRVADVGAGTGLFTALFAREVGPRGWVFAVEISPRFLERLGQVAREQGLPNVSPMLGAEKSIRLPPQSIDVAFVCDTYHHFEFPQSTLASIRQALRPGGRLVVIDFERIEGQSREWVLGHVRAGKAEFREEIEAAGFKFVAETDIEGLEENYFLVFQSPDG